MRILQWNCRTFHSKKKLTLFSDVFSIYSEAQYSVKMSSEMLTVLSEHFTVKTLVNTLQWSTPFSNKFTVEPLHSSVNTLLWNLHTIQWIFYSTTPYTTQRSFYNCNTPITVSSNPVNTL